MRRLLQLCVLATVAVTATATVAAAPPTFDAGAYDRAARFLVQNASVMVLNATVTPHWRDDGAEYFTYIRELGDGRSEFVRIDTEAGIRSRPFDPKIVAQGLAKVSGDAVDPQRLPFRDYEQVTPGSIGFTVGMNEYTCSTSQPSCEQVTSAVPDPLTVPSPDGRWIAFVRDNNLWIRTTDGSASFALTTDGVEHAAYAGSPECDPLVTERVLRGQPMPAVVLWSPDSRRIFTQRIDERAVREVGLVQSVPPPGGAPSAALRWRFAMAGEPNLPVAESWIFDVAQKRGHRVQMEPISAPFTTSIEAKEAWWTVDSARVYLFSKTRYSKTMRLHEIDAASGAARLVIEESGRTFVEAGTNGQRPMVRVLASGDVLWFSERDGRGHLYLYDGSTGRLRRQLTQGDWSVRSILRLDEPRRLLYVAATERERDSDPYHRRIYRLSLADDSVKLLTPEEADHFVVTPDDSVYAGIPATAAGFAPSGRYFLDTYSRADQAPVTVLRRADGREVAVIESADISRVVAAGLTLPERFSALAADGKTRLYGNLLRPSNFDPSRKYPVIDSLYPGPQAHKAYPRLLDTVFGYTADQALAELGFIVVQMDGRGTPGRSKTFLDESYGLLGQAGQLDDHVAVIRELARRYPHLDPERVGAYGGSAGGHAALRALLVHPEFYKVGVAAAGSHNISLQSAAFSEKFMGPDDGQNYLRASNVPLAGQLHGKLLLLHGDTDWTVLLANTVQVVDAMANAGKQYDLVLLPNVGHSPLGVHGSYALRRTWDYFVEHLLGLQPPVGYQFAR